jgi:hypothetical protein
MQQGGSTAPVAAGKYAWVDGLARALQGVAGGYITKQQQKKFKTREDKYMADMQAALAGGQAPAAGTDTPSMVETRNAIRPSMAPLTQVDPNDFVDAPALAPQTPPMAMPAPPMAPPSQAAPMAPQTAPAQGMATPPMAAPTPRPALDPTTLFMKGIVPIEGGTDRNGNFRTSPAGAIGPAQVMPATAPEAAKLAGVPFNDRLYRTDAEYNLTLGQAYFNKQLQDFGDPLKAAAAYNGGAGALRRAVRRATKAGEPENWVNYYPKANTETPAYVRKFSESFGLNGIGDTPLASAANTAPSNSNAGVVPLQMEAVPELDPALANVARPAAPELPKKVESQRLAVAKRLMATGNPDLMAIAQGYLNEGLGEDFTASTNTNQQQFQQGQTGYTADLNNYGDAQSAARGDMYTGRRNAETRNFTRETQNNSNAFTVANREDEQNFNNAAREDTQSFTALENAADRDATWRNIKSQIDASAGTAEEKVAARRAGFYNTATGAKLFDKMQAELTTANGAVNDLARMEYLAGRIKSGGFMGLPWLDSIGGAVSPDIAEFNALSSKYTLDKIGGSLGAQISNSDRDYVERQAPSVGKPAEANKRLIRLRRAVVERGIEYQNRMIQAIPEGKQAEFVSNWQKYINAVSIKKNISYEDWMARRPKFNANGERVN